MKKPILLLPALLLVFNSHSQDLAVHFPLDVDALSSEEKMRILDLAHQVNQEKVSVVSIDGYADVRGTHAYNHDLSKRRAQKVLLELHLNGVDTAGIKFRFHGETQSGNSDFHHDRRVDIVLAKPEVPDYVKTYKDYLEWKKPIVQTYYIQEAERGFTIEGGNGTRIEIPPSALHIDGTPVKGGVKVELQEFYDPASFISDNLQTTSHGEMIASAGTINLTILSGGKEANLSKPASIQFVQRDQESYQAFYGTRNEDGLMVWDTSATKQIRYFAILKAPEGDNFVVSAYDTTYLPDAYMNFWKSTPWVTSLDAFETDLGIRAESVLDQQIELSSDQRVSDESREELRKQQEEYQKRQEVENQKAMEELKWNREDIEKAYERQQRMSTVANSLIQAEVTGYINCDRFMNDPLARPISMNLKTSGGDDDGQTMYHIYFPRINSVLTLHSPELNMTLIPGEVIEVIAVNSNDEQVYAKKVSSTVQHNKELMLSLKPSTIRDLDKQISSL